MWAIFAKIAFEVSLGLNHAHLCSYIHGDIKSLNILVMADCAAKLSDFGLSKFSLENDASDSLSVSLPWAAPEILKQVCITFGLLQIFVSLLIITPHLLS